VICRVICNATVVGYSSARKAGVLYRLSLIISITSKNSLDCLSKIIAFGSNISAGFLSAILIRGNLKDLLLKFARIFRVSARIRSVDNVTVNYKRIYSRIPAAINGFLEQILKESMLNFGDIFD
jgi:hypothetical protein